MDSRGNAGFGALRRWFVAYGFFGIPQAAGPIAFSLLALQVTGDAANGAAIVMATTAAQIVGAVPFARLGRKFNASAYLRVLIAVRVLSLAVIAALAFLDAPFYLLAIVGALGGLVNGAAYGYLRVVLSSIVEPSRLLRAIGIGATVNELTFVVAPVVASAIGTFSPVLAICAMAFLGAAPSILILRTAPLPVPEQMEMGGSLLNSRVIAWLWCSAAGGATVAVIEIGAISLAVDFGFRPALGVVFTVALCVASVSGGIWVSARNRMAHKFIIPLLLAIMMIGIGLVACRYSVKISVVGCLMVGIVMAPLSTHYSLVLDSLAPVHRKAEVFALLRTANSLGVIFISALLVWTSLQFALLTAAAALAIAAVRIASMAVGDR